MSGQQNPQPAGSSGASQNPFQPPSLQHRIALIPANEARKRAADVSLEESPEAKRNAPEPADESAMDDYMQDCEVPGCVHVVLNVGDPAVKFTLCKTSLQHESQYFRAALDSGNFEEGEDLVVNLLDVDPEDFLVYIKTIFPTCADDYQALSMTTTTGVDGGMMITVRTLVNLFYVIDRFGSLFRSNVRQRVLKCMRLLCELTPEEGTWSHWQKMCLLKGFSMYNMDQDREIFEQLLKIDFIIHDATTMEQVKPRILHPIMAKAVAKLIRNNTDQKRKISSLEDVIDSPTTLEMCCVPCKTTISLGNRQTLPAGTLQCGKCKRDFIIRRKQKPY